MIVNEYFSIDDGISFNVYPAALLGNSFTRVKVLAVVDADTAKLLGIDPVALHAAIYPTLPLENKVIYKKYNDYKYIKVKLPNGTTTALGLPWINMSTVQVITTATARFTVTLDNPTQVDAVVALLNANGYNNVVVETL